MKDSCIKEEEDQSLITARPTALRVLPSSSRGSRWRYGFV